jgi:hypothetical protein
MLKFINADKYFFTLTFPSDKMETVNIVIKTEMEEETDDCENNSSSLKVPPEEIIMPKR